jgi:hypothetical protein
MWKFLPLGVLAALLAALPFLLGTPANAAGPCGTSHDGISAEEAEFAGLLQAWRNANLDNSTPLTLSGPLNAAAAWFAQDQVTHGGGGGHLDSVGRTWGTRALDCGFPNPYAEGGSGEGVYSVSSSQVLDIGPAQAIAGITYPGSGVYIQVPPDFSIPVKCFGVAVYRSENGKAVSWVTVIAQFPANTACPAPVTGTPSTATPTPTKTKTASPTPSATPPVVHNHPLTLSPNGWVFVVLPQGSLNSVLARAKGCYNAVYQLQGDAWLRYSPDIPAFARSLTFSNGGVFWISGSGKDCGTIIL